MHRHALARGLALALVTALTLAAVTPVFAQGLREDARALLAEVGAGFTEPCQARDRLVALLAEVERAQGAPYMEAEVRDLRALQARVEAECSTAPPAPDAGSPAPDAGPPAPDAGPPAPDAGPPAPDAGPDLAAPDRGARAETLVEHCDRLMRQEAWCEVLASCTALADMDGRYKTLLSRAERGCPFF